MPYPPRNRPLAEDDDERGPQWNLVDGFIRGISPDVIEDLIIAGTKNTWDAAGAGLNFALSRSSVPLSTGVIAAEAQARGGTFSEKQVKEYTQRAQEVSPLRGTGFISPMVAGMTAAERAYDYGVNRPIGTAALLSNIDSPLYNGNPVKAVDENGNPVDFNMRKGFQLEDIQAAWNRTEKISAGQAIATNETLVRIAPVAGVLPIFNALGGFDQYDPWNDASIEEAQNNPFFVAVSGGIDLGLQIVVPPAVRGARIAGMRKLGLTNTIRSAQELAVMRSDFERHLPESPTAYGQVVQDIAAEGDLQKIRQHPIVANNIGANKYRLSRVLSETDDPSTVNEILLANMGDVTAIRRLANSAPDTVWTLAEVDDAIRASAMQGVRLRPLGDSLAQVNQVFDSALKRDNYFRILKDELTAPDGSLMLNSTWKPTSSIIVEKVRKAGYDVGYAVKTGDWSESPQWIRQRLTDGKGSWLTSRMQWAGSRSPLGHVSNSGLRPEDKFTEFNAQMDSVPEFRGNRMIVIKDQEMQAFEWRSSWEQRLAEATDAELPNLWREMENEAIDYIARELDIDSDVASKIADAYRSSISAEIEYIRGSNGYIFDEQGERFIIDPVTKRQMLSSFQTLPLEEIRRQMIENSSFFRGKASSLQDVGIDVYDFVQKIFRTDVLFRPGYTGKNSIVEPLISRFIAHGTILTDEGLWATMGNVGKNVARVSKRLAYYSQVRKLVDPSLRTSAKKEEVKRLLVERYNLQQIIDAAVAELDSWNGPDTWPRMEAIYGPEVRGALFNAQKRMESIDATLDGVTPEWRQVVEPATLADVRQKLREYRAIIGDDPEYVETLWMQRDQILRDARARVQSPKEQAEVGLVRLEQQLARLQEEQKTLSEEYQIGGTDLSTWSVATDGRQRAPRPAEPGETGDLARGRDYRGLALKRQIESVEKQIEDARVKVESASDEVEVSLTPNEQTTVNNINTVLDRVRESPSSAADPEVAAIRESIEELETSYNQLVEMKQQFDETNTPYAISDLADAMEELEGRLSLAQASLRETQGRNRRVIDSLGKRGYAGTGEGDMVLNIYGERYIVPKAFDQRDRNFGSGIRAEASAETTNRFTLDPSDRGDYETSRWQRANGPAALDSNHPAYWDTLSYVVNGFFRGDLLVQRILNGDSRASIAAWLRTNEGIAYQKAMGSDYLVAIDNYDPISVSTADVDRLAPAASPDVTNIKGKSKRTKKIIATETTNVDIGRQQSASRVLTSSTTGLDEIIRLVEQYIPDEAVRKQAADAELSAGDLQAALGGRTDLARIAGADFDYLPSRMKRAQNILNKTLDKVWQWIATNPEDRIARWPFYQYEFRRQLEQRGRILADQGMNKLSPDQIYALRQDAHRSSLRELEKTFYNIRRYSTPVYNSRFLMTFPGAFFNSIYRWSRFSVREPERVIQLGVFGADIARNFAVDENGEPVKNLSEAKYFVMPFTGNPESFEPGKQFRVSSFQTLFPDYPSVSIGMMSAATMAQIANANFTSFLEDNLGPVMEEIFPYGISDNPVSNFAGGWQKDAWRWANQYLGVNDEDRNRAMIQIYDYRMYEWMKAGGDPDTMPSIDDAAAEAGAMYGAQALEKLFAAFSVKHEAPGAWFADEWNRVFEKNDFDKDKATEEYIKLYGNEAIYFTFGDNKRTTYVPPTVAAWNRIFVENIDLAKRLVKFDPDNPEYVGLLAYGTDGEYAPEIADAMRRTPLPGDDVPILSSMTAADYESFSLRQIGWDAYTKGRIRYDADSLRLRKLRDAATNEFERQKYRNQLATLDGQWSSWVELLKAQNDPFRKSIAGGGKDAADSASQYLREITSDPKFVADHSSDPIWQNVVFFLDKRDEALAVYKTLPDSDKKTYKRQFTEYVVSNIAANDVHFADLWARYFAQEWQTDEMKVEEDSNG